MIRGRDQMFKSSNKGIITMKLRSSFFSTVLIAGLFLNGCSDTFLDVNNDPNSPTSAPLYLQAAPIIAAFSHNMFDHWPAHVSSYWTQQTSSSQARYYYETDLYQVGQPFFTFGDVYDTGYATIIKNARIMGKMAEEDGSLNYVGVAYLMEAWTMAFLTDMFGDIPYSEAWDATVLAPKYDKQEDIYTAIHSLIDKAITAFGENHALKLGGGDLIYDDGDPAKWAKLAYSLKARYQMRLSEAPGDKNARASAALAAVANGFKSNADNAHFKYPGADLAGNPWYRVKFAGTRTTDSPTSHRQMSTHYIDLLKSLSDPRLPLHADEAITGGGYHGTANGAFLTDVSREAQDGVSGIGTLFTSRDSPGRLMDYAEVKFIEAEATFIISGAGAADPIYRDAIKADMEENGVAAADITTYLASLPSLSASTNAHKDIMIQKYIANFCTPEPWNDWRRTGYPEIISAYDTYSGWSTQHTISNTFGVPINEVPRRMPWPSSELNYNMETVSETGLPISPDIMSVKVWWDTR